MRNWNRQAPCSASSGTGQHPGTNAMPYGAERNALDPHPAGDYPAPKGAGAAQESEAFESSTSFRGER